MVYQDIPELFRWDEKKKKWFRYQRYFASMGRLVHCSPNDKERFFLRVLLTYRKGPTSYEDLKTVNGYVCSTFYEAAERAGFLENDKEWDNCLSEGSLFQLPYQLRQLFAIVLLHCNPSKYEDLWEKYCDSLSGDFEYRFREDNDKERRVKFNTLTSLNELLMASAKELADFERLPQLSLFPELVREALMGNNLIERETSYNPEVLRRVIDESNLNNSQQAIYEEVTQAVFEDNPQQRLFFIDGPGGTGKSTLIKKILAKVRGEGKIALAVASSGITSLLLPGGRTAHSMFKIPLKLNEKSTCNISKQSKLAALLKKTSIIIWDEAPMTHRFALGAVDRTLRDILESPEPFEGLVVVLSGDFRQILLAIKRDTPADTIYACLKASDLWKKFTQVRLTVNMRVFGAADPDTAAELGAFAGFLLMVGEGRHEVDPELGRDMMEIPRDILISNPRYDPGVVHDVETHQFPISLGLKRIVDAMYNEEDLNNPNVATDNYFADRTILAPTNAAVQSVNEAVANRLCGQQHIYVSTDSVLDANEEMRSAFVETEILNSIKISGLPPHKLVLKVGAPVMLIRNLNADAGLCNGTRLREEVLIPRILFTSEEDIREFPFRPRRKQFPIVPAFAMTINKAQGQTVQKMGLYLPSSCFSHGQLYVALSRVPSRHSLKILIEPSKKAQNGEETAANQEEELHTANIVYRQVLE